LGQGYLIESKSPQQGVGHKKDEKRKAPMVLQNQMGEKMRQPKSLAELRKCSERRTAL